MGRIGLAGKRNSRNISPAGMKLIIRSKSEDVTEWAAKYVIKRINAFNPGPKKMFVLGLPTGGTPLAMYRKLVQAHKAGKVSFKHVITFNMDEYVGIPEDHPESYHRYMFDNFFKHIDIDTNNTLMVCDEDATLELRVRTVKYFKDMWNVHASLN